MSIGPFGELGVPALVEEPVGETEEIAAVGVGELQDLLFLE